MRAAAGIAVVVAASVLGASLPAHAAPKDVGRKHLSRANQLASQGKCRAALPEFDKAFDLLADPVILFNRGECYRKVGEPAQAVEDYRQFLELLPNAPNRAAVEARIAELTPAEADAAPAKKSAASPSRSAPPVADPPEPVPPEEEETGRDPAAEVPRPAPARAVQISEVAEDDAGAPGAFPTWVWIGLGAVVVGAAAAGGWLLFGREKTQVPASTLGNYRF